MRSSTLRGLVATPTALALALGGVLLGAGPASAAPLPVTSPVGTFANAEAQPEFVEFTGTGLTVGSSIQVDYNAVGAPTEARLAGQRYEVDGTWNVAADLGDLALDTTAVTATVTAVAADGTPDPAFEPATLSFELAFPANPSELTLTTRPVELDAVPTLAGTAAAGSTVTATYPAADGTVATAGSGTADALGAFSFTGDFTALAPGVTETQLTLTQTAPVRAEVVSVPVTFAVAPVPVVDPPVDPPVAPTLSFQPDAPTVTEAATTGVQITATGFGVSETVSSVLTAPDGTVVPLTETGLVSDVDGLVEGTLIFTGPVGVYALTLTGDVSDTSVSGSLTLVADQALLPTPVIEAPSDGQVVVDTQLTVSGTAQPGTGIVLSVLPVGFE